MTGRASILRADARHLPLPDSCVDLVVTSPPFLNLRSYQDGGQHYDGQIGVGSRDRFLEDLWDATAEMVRVLKPTGSIFVELGDSYTDKCLNLSPHRYALGCTDRLGLYLRAEIIWNRPNGLPESVTDRVRRAHSVWFHMVTQPRYYSAVDEIREDHAGEFLSSGVKNPRFGRPGGQMPGRAAGVPERRGEIVNGTHGNNFTAPLNPLGKLPGSVWTIPTQPLRVPPELGVDHFAAFPMEWPRRIIQGWSPAGICTGCGEGRRPVSDREPRTDVAKAGPKHMVRYSAKSGLGTADLYTITGYACGCPEPTAPTRPAVVLDPFGGTGTVALVAKALGRIGISIDLSQDYSRLATWRTNDPGQLADALQIEKPDIIPDDQLSLLDYAAGISP